MLGTTSDSQLPTLTDCSIDHRAAISPVATALPVPDKTSSRLLAARLSNPSSLTADDGKTAPEHRMQKSARLVVSQDVHGELAAARRANYRRTRLPSRARARRS